MATSSGQTSQNENVGSGLSYAPHLAGSANSGYPTQPPVTATTPVAPETTPTTMPPAVQSIGTHAVGGVNVQTGMRGSVTSPIIENAGPYNAPYVNTVQDASMVQAATIEPANPVNNKSKSLATVNPVITQYYNPLTTPYANTVQNVSSVQEQTVGAVNPALKSHLPLVKTKVQTAINTPEASLPGTVPSKVDGSTASPDSVSGTSTINSQFGTSNNAQATGTTVS